MIKYFYITILSIISFTSFSCEVSGPANVIYSKGKSKGQALQSLNYENCTDIEIRKIQSSLSDFEGTIRRRTLVAEIPNSKITVKAPITFKRLESLINEKVELPKDWRLIKPDILGSNKKTISYKNGALVSIECQSCQNTGLKNLKLEVYDHLSSQKKTIWLRASVAVKTSVLVATQVLPVTHRGLSLHEFKRKFIYSTTPEAYFTNKDQLVFYKLNRGKKIDQAIKFTDLSALNLVRPGQVVKTSLMEGVIKLKGSATPMRAGKLGEIIQLRSTNSKKIIIGRITNFNEVEVEI